MRNKTILLVVASIFGTMPITAQDIIFRRPLPNRGFHGTQQSCTPGELDCAAGDPFSPGQPMPGGDPGPGVDVYQWDVGPWQGDATCGIQSTLTRSVTCRGHGEGGSVDGLFDALGLPGMSAVRSGEDEVLDPRYCLDDIGPQPAARYTGRGAGCGYEAVVSTPASVDDGTADNPENIDTAWRMPPGTGGSLSCSAQAYRKLPFTCRDQSGKRVANSLCVENPTTGGTRNDWLPEIQTGNYSACDAHWKVADTDLGCHPEGDPHGGDGGPVRYAMRRVSCVASDGQVLTGAGEAACDTDPDRPFEGVTIVGSCVAVADTDSRTSRCLADGANVVRRVTLTRQNQDLGRDTLSEATSCFAAGANCVSSRTTADDNYSREPNNTTELICTKGVPESYYGPMFFGLFGSHYYTDECGSSSGGSCPTFFNNGDYRRVWVPAT